VSFPAKDIVATMEKALLSGAREFHLTAQDTGCWGGDRGETLADLLLRIEEMKGDFFVRVGMMNPDNVIDFLDDLVSAFLHPRIYKFLHLPVQSGSERVLSDMGRRYSREDVLEIVSAFRKKIKGLYLCTDIIVGFPTETEEDFLETLDFVAQLAPDKINQTMYSARPKTLASSMRQIPDWIKKERSRLLFKLRMDIAQSINREYVGKKFSCFINECGKKRNSGRLFNYKPVVADGFLGETREVEISGCTPNYLLSR